MCLYCTLADVLSDMGTDSSREHARICHIEQASPSELAVFRSFWMCDICQQVPLRGTTYIYLGCYDCQICNLCYPDYLEGDGTPMTVPQSLKTICKLENDVKPVRELAKNFIIFRGEFLYRYCEKLVVVHEWIEEKLKEYEDWEKAHNHTGRFDSYKRPGQMFLKIVEKIRKLAEEPEKTKVGNTDENSMSKIDEELDELFREHKPDKE
jgi:hypothetical protein